MLSMGLALVFRCSRQNFSKDDDPHALLRYCAKHASVYDYALGVNIYICIVRTHFDSLINDAFRQNGNIIKRSRLDSTRNSHDLEHVAFLDPNVVGCLSNSRMSIELPWRRVTVSAKLLVKNGRRGF